MASSPFTDKKILDRVSCPLNSDFLELAGSHENSIDPLKDDIVPSYDFQHVGAPVHSRPLCLDDSNDGVPMDCPSSSSNINNSNRNFGSMITPDIAKVIVDKDRNVFDVAVVGVIDQTMVKHTDNMLHALEGLSSQLSQLESRTRHLESSIDDLNVSVGNYQGTADGKMRQLENILREVQSVVEVLRYKQDIMETNVQPAVLEESKVEPQSKTPDPDVLHPPPPTHHPASSRLSFREFTLPPASWLRQSFRDFTPPPPPPSSGQSFWDFTPPPPPPSSLQSLKDFTPPPPPPDPPLPALPHHPYTPPNFNSLQPYPSLPVLPCPPLPPPPNFFMEPPPALPHLLQRRPASECAFPHHGPYPLVGHYNGGDITAMQNSSPARGGYPELPKARVLQHPTESGEPNSSGISSSSSRAPPIDEVVEKVAGMGFPRDQVSAMVRKLTETGHAVDFNVVLDKLTNGGSEQASNIGSVRGFNI